MTDIVLFHHVQGLTPGVEALAESLRGSGHTVHMPDLFDGRTFATLDEGMAHAREIGFGALLDRGVAAGEEAAQTPSTSGSRWASCRPEARPDARRGAGSRPHRLLHPPR